MHEKTEQIAFVPTAALLDPVHEVAVGFFERDRLDDTDSVPLALQAHTQVGVFGHVEGVPCSNFVEHRPFEVIRGATEWNRSAECNQPRQELREPLCVLDGKPLGEQVVAVVVKLETGLDARDVVLRAKQRNRGPSQLQRLWDVFCVVDRHQVSTAQFQPVVARLRLGSWQPGGNEYDFDELRQRFTPCGLRFNRVDRVVVVFFEEQLDLKFVDRVFQQCNRTEKVVYDLWLLVCRNQYRVHRQQVVGERTGLVV